EEALRRSINHRYPCFVGIMFFLVLVSTQLDRFPALLLINAFGPEVKRKQEDERCNESENETVATPRFRQIGQTTIPGCSYKAESHSTQTDDAERSGEDPHTYQRGECQETK